MNQPELANQDLVNQVFQKILQEKPSLIPNACQCHLIDPHKMRMLLWKDKDTYILKIAEQKFVGVARQDKRGEVYWKFRELYESESKSAESKTSPSSPEIEVNQPLSPAANNLDRLAKFQERQAKAQQSQTKWIEGKERLAQLEKEKAERKIQENISTPNNHVNNSTSTTEPAN